MTMSEKQKETFNTTENANTSTIPKKKEGKIRNCKKGKVEAQHENYPIKRPACNLKSKKLYEEEVYGWAKLKDCSVVMPKMPGWFVNLMKNQAKNAKIDNGLTKMKDSLKNGENSNFLLYSW